MAPAQRFDVLVDFQDVTPGTTIYLINEGPDSPFGGGTPQTNCDDGTGCFEAADPGTTGQVMAFYVTEDTSVGNQFDDLDVANLDWPAFTPLQGDINNTRELSLNEEVSQAVCVVTQEDGTSPRFPSMILFSAVLKINVLPPNPPSHTSRDQRSSGRPPHFWGLLRVVHPIL